MTHGINEDSGSEKNGVNEDAEEDLAILKLTDSIGDSITDGCNKYKSLFPSALIYRVPEDLRQQKNSAYTPRLISIGPFHRDSSCLPQAMQFIKKHFADYLLFRLAKNQQRIANIKTEALKDCVKKIMDRLDVAKRYYAEAVRLKDSEMVEMLLVDGCFILELLYADHLIKTEGEKETKSGVESGNSKGTSSSSRGGAEQRTSHPIFDIILTANIVKQDLLLLENQIPFFVLEELFKLTVDRIQGKKKLSLAEYVVSYFGDIMTPEGENNGLFRERRKNCSRSGEKSGSEKKTSCCSPSDFVLWVCGSEKENIETWEANEVYDHILHLLHDYYRPETPDTGDVQVDRVKKKKNKKISAKVPWAWRPCTAALPCCTQPKKFSALEVRASELDYGGVKFEPVDGNNPSGVKFKEPKGICWWFHRATFEIPTVVIHDPTELILRNLIAFEQLCGSRVPRYFTSYAKLMDVLINSEKDVEVLSGANVIRNFLGTDKDVSDLLNKLCKEVVVGFFFNDECQKASEYSKRWWPRYMAYWRRTYVASPWAFIGFCIALIAFGIQIASFILNFLK